MASVRVYGGNPTWYCKLKSQNKNVWTGSLKTDARREADEVAAELLRIYELVQKGADLPDEIHTVVRRALKIKPKFDDLKRQSLFGQQALHDASRRARTEKELHDLGTVNRDLIRVTAQLKQETLRREVAEREQKRLEEKIAGLELMLRAAGREKLARIKNSTLGAARDAYLKTSTAGARTRNGEYKSQLKALCAHFGKDKQIQSIPPEAICAFVSHYEAKIAYKRKMLKLFSHMLKRQTGGAYPVEELDDYRKTHYRDTGKADADFYWITDKQAKQLAENASGDYWADAMLVQFALALRPEELPLLQAKNVNLNRNRMPVSIYVGPVVGVRGLKTNRSASTLPIPTAMRKTIKNRVAGTSGFLFPNPKNALWRHDTWNKAYAAALAVAATKAKLDTERLDARTLRRSRGKDLLDKGYTPAQAAAFLRDGLPTFLKHYARFIPTDVKV